MDEALEIQFIDSNYGLESFGDRLSEIISFEWTQREAKKFYRFF